MSNSIPESQLQAPVDVTGVFQQNTGNENYHIQLSGTIDSNYEIESHTCNWFGSGDNIQCYIECVFGGPVEPPVSMPFECESTQDGYSLSNEVTVTAYTAIPNPELDPVGTNDNPPVKTSRGTEVVVQSTGEEG